MRYDAEIRQLMISRGRLGPEMLDFLLGRPLQQVVRLLERPGDSPMTATDEDG
jgi:hypothetical protein